MSDRDSILDAIAVLGQRLDNIDRNFAQLRADIALHRSHQDDEIEANKKKLMTFKPSSMNHGWSLHS